MATPPRVVEITDKTKEALLSWVCSNLALKGVKEKNGTVTYGPLEVRPRFNAVDAHSRRAQVNQCFPERYYVRTIADLCDGVVLSKLLQDLDETFDPREIEIGPNTTRWLTKKRNLQVIHRALFRFIHRESSDLAHLSSLVDFDAIADNPTADSIAEVEFFNSTEIDRKLTDVTTQLLCVFVYVCFCGPSPTKYVGRLQASHDNNVKVEIQKIILGLETELKKAVARKEAQTAIDDLIGPRDAALVSEEERALLLNQLDKSRKQQADTISRLERLQESYDALKEQEEQAQAQLEILNKIMEESAPNTRAVAELSKTVEELNILVQTQEEAANTDREMRESLQRELSLTEKKLQLAEKASEDLNELKYQNSELSKKVNTIHWYEQKIRDLQQDAKDVEDLIQQRDHLRADLAKYEETMDWNASLREELEQLRLDRRRGKEKMNKLEVEKRALAENIQNMEQTVQILEAQKSSDERQINELYEQLATGGMSAAGLSLEQELSNASDTGSLTPSLEISRLKAENQMLKKSIAASTENANQMREDMDETRRQIEKLWTERGDILEEQMATQRQLSRLMAGAKGETGALYERLQHSLDETKSQLKVEQERTRELEAEVADKTREVASAKADLAAIEKDRAEALEDLKSTDEFIAKSIQEELEALRARYRELKATADEQREHLLRAFIEKDQYRKEIDDLKSQGPAAPGSSDDPELARKHNEKMEKIWARLKTRTEQLEKSEHEKHELQRKLKSLQSPAAGSAAQKASTEQFIKTLQRENGLIATAWYDLTSRLQSNHITLQRRQDMPKSWINKQRLMVNSTPRR